MLIDKNRKNVCSNYIIILFKISINYNNIFSVSLFPFFFFLVRVDLRIKHANICNVLKKRTLSSVDIFIFNDTRSVSGEDHNLYRILEDIKDGQATASKYDNDNIYFKTPNIVVVFSNQYPDTKKLSYDRWIILKINDQELENVTQAMAKKGKRYSVNRQKSEECMLYCIIIFKNKV